MSEFKSKIVRLLAKNEDVKLEKAKDCVMFFLGNKVDDIYNSKIGNKEFEECDSVAREDFSVKDGQKMDWTKNLKMTDERKEEIRKTEEYKMLKEQAEIEVGVVRAENLQELDFSLSKFENFLSKKLGLETSEFIFGIKNKLEKLAESNREFADQIDAMHEGAGEIAEEVIGSRGTKEGGLDAEIIPFNKK